MELPIKPKSERIGKTNYLKSKTSSKDEDDSIDLKRKNSNLYVIDSNAFKNYKNGSYIKEKFDDFILLIQTIVRDEGIDLYKIEQKLIDLQNDKILNHGKKYIFE